MRLTDNDLIWFVFMYGDDKMILQGHPYNITDEEFTIVDKYEEGCPPQYIVSYTHCKIKDYGKTWALTKEELE